MGEGVVIAVIGLLGSAIGAFAGIVLNNRLVVYRLEQVEKKVDSLNKEKDRINVVDRHLAVIDEEIKVINHRINDLEQFHKPT